MAIRHRMAMAMPEICGYESGRRSRDAEKVGWPDGGRSALQGDA